MVAIEFTRFMPAATACFPPAAAAGESEQAE